MGTVHRIPTRIAARDPKLALYLLRAPNLKREEKEALFYDLVGFSGEDAETQVSLALQAKDYEGTPDPEKMKRALCERLLESENFSNLRQVCRQVQEGVVRDQVIAKFATRADWAYRILDDARVMRPRADEVALLVDTIVSSKRTMLQWGKNILQLYRFNIIAMDTTLRLRVFEWMGYGVAFLHPDEYLRPGEQYTQEERAFFLARICKDEQLSHALLAFEGREGKKEYANMRFPALQDDERRVLLEPAYRWAIKRVDVVGMQDLLTCPAGHLFSHEQEQELRLLQPHLRNIHRIG